MSDATSKVARRISAGLALAFALAIVPACSKQGESLPPDTEPAAAADRGAVSVTTATVAFRPVQRYVGLVGTLYGYEETTVGAEVGGRVKKITHEVADRVRPGEVLIEIDPTDFQLAVRQAQKELQVELAKLGLSEPPNARTDVTKIPMVVQARLKRDNAQVRLDRAKTLVQKKAAPEEELTERTSEFRVYQSEYDNQILLAKAGIAAILVKQEALAIAEQRLKDTLVHAPRPSLTVPGDDDTLTHAITKRAVSEGEYVMEGAELLTLVIDDPLKFRGRVPERLSGEVRLGQKAKLFTAAYTEPFDGEVVRINPAIDPATRAFEVEILVPNREGKLKPGGFAKTGILTTLDERAATVPLEALVHFAGVSKIFLVEDGKAKEVQVSTGMQETDWVEIAAPSLPPGAVVITSGQTAIADGTEVAVRGEAAATAAVAAHTAGTEPPAPAESSAPVPPVARHEGTP
ncbi:MAG: efflux RND transporter periplasmic adaptor subunit [Pirellulales bacterium]